MGLGCLERLDWVTMEALWKVRKQPGSVGPCWVAREGDRHRVRFHPEPKVSWEVW